MEHSPRIAVISFPGNNCEVESMRALRTNGMEPLFFRWNDDRSKLSGVDGYFIPGGFSYEDRGRSGMVAGRDPLMDFIGQEAEAGKTVIGNCNGAQILIESGLIPLGESLDMSLARNAIASGTAWTSPGFLSEWIWITPSCAKHRCATSDWEGTMHLPIAHGEGRFATKDKDLMAELRKNDQIAFSYCDAEGQVSENPSVTPNGSSYAIAGICNPQGNVVALMPHPERTDLGDPYFTALGKWISRGKSRDRAIARSGKRASLDLKSRSPKNIEIFIDTIITNNEERTVEQTARRYLPDIRLKQWKYFTIAGEPQKLLSDLTVFNANKERAFIRRGSALSRWNAQSKMEEKISPDKAHELFDGIVLLRRDEPDTGAAGLGQGSETGVCYVCRGVDAKSLQKALEVFANLHASTLEQMTASA